MVVLDDSDVAGIVFTQPDAVGVLRVGSVRGDGVPFGEAV